MITILPFGLSSNGRSVIVQSHAGFFEIDYAPLIDILSYISGKISINEDEILKRLKEKGDDDPAAVLDTLFYEIEVLAKGGRQVQCSFIVNDDNFATALKSSFPNGTIFNSISDIKYNQKNDHIVVLAYRQTPERDTVEQQIKYISKNNYIITTYPLRENFVISPTWRKKSAIPCPCCMLDYSTDRIFFNISETNMSLHEVFKLTKQGSYYALPEYPIEYDDLTFIARHLRRRINAIEGIRWSYISRLDPFEANSIDLSSLTYNAFHVPFSPLCNCVRPILNESEV